jgi:hypothetical protein
MSDSEEKKEPGALTSPVKKKPTTGGGGSTVLRSELGIDELRGHIFIYGSRNQTDKYIRTKKAIGEYVGTKYGKQMWRLVAKHEETLFKDPDDPGEDAKRVEIENYKMLLRMTEEEKQYQEDKSKVFRLIMGQCTTTMRNKLEACDTYDDLEAKDDIVGLLEPFGSWFLVSRRRSTSIG